MALRLPHRTDQPAGGVNEILGGFSVDYNFTHKMLFNFFRFITAPSQKI